MAEAEGKYDYLITHLLPIHKTLLSIEDDKESLIKCIHELKEYIGIHDSGKAGHLKSLLNSLVFPNRNSKTKLGEKAIPVICRNEALNILTKFLIELNPDEEKS